MSVKCPRDGKGCYIHLCPFTRVELRCRHYNDLQRYGGVCPDIEQEAEYERDCMRESRELDLKRGIE